MRNIQRLRSGFTLIELLVAATLSMFIMGIIAVAFQKSIDTFRILRSVGQMQEKLKSAQMVLKRDLTSEHFGGTFRPGFGGPYVRDQRLDLSGWTPPDQGYFQIVQPSPGNWEGIDSDGLWSTYAVDHSLRFTVKLSGAREQDWFYAFPASGNVFPTPVLNNGDPNFNRPDSSNNSGVATRWAEVSYFLSSNGFNANGSALYNLYRRQSGLLPTQTPTGGNPSPDLSVIGANYVSPTDVTNPAFRLPLSPMGGTQLGDDILVSDVLSFEVKVNWTPASAGITGPSTNFPTPFNLVPPGNRTVAYPEGNKPNLDWPFDLLPNIAGWGMKFDTMTQNITPVPSTPPNWDDPTSFQTMNGTPKLRIRVNTIQIRLRIWDANTQQARQITIVQDI